MKPGDKITLTDLSEAHRTAIASCNCGCGSIKLIYLDGKGKPFAMAGFTLDSWTAIDREMKKAFLATAPVDQARPS